MKNITLFAVRAINIPGIVIVWATYIAAILYQYRKKKDVSRFEPVLRNNLLLALPWVTFAVWAISLTTYFFKL